jgi:hypothetical protein
MTELSGFTAAQPKAVIAPQKMIVPSSKEEAVARAAEILQGIWDAVESGLSPVVKIIVHQNPTGQTYCDITPFDHDGVADMGVAMPGHYLVIDGTRLRSMTRDGYAELFEVDEEPEAEEDS